MVRRGGLNKNSLDVLISPDLEEEISRQQSSGTQTLRISLLEPNKDQPRKKFEDDSLVELADSIKSFGVLQPILVVKKGKFYEIIAGERRWRAAKLAGLKEVPVIIKQLSTEEGLEISLIENIQRENLNPIEEAKAYKQLIDTYQLTQDQISERVSKSRAAITNFLRLLNLDERVQQMMMEELISNGHGRALLAIKDKDKQYELANLILDHRYSVRETEKMIQQLLNPKAGHKQKEKDVNIKYIETQLEEIVGTKVQISNNVNKGKIQIEYYSKDDLERIVDLLYDSTK